MSDAHFMQKEDNTDRYRFWDVNEIIFRLQVGGETRGGKLLLDALEAHLEIEDGIPLVCFLHLLPFISHHELTHTS